MTISPDRAPATPAPRRKEYVASVVVAVVGLLVSAVLLGLVKSGAELGQPLTAGEPVTVHIGASEETVVWARYHGGPLPEIECSLSPEPQGSRQLRPAMEGLGVAIDVDGERWVAQRLISAEPAGSYDVTCLTFGRHPATLSIGELPRFHSDRDRFLLQVGALGTAGITVVAVGLLLLIPALRRRSRRAHLEREPAGSQQ
ncbi:hypothetical protein ACK8GE_00465 [Micromonosporaceae bacterium DT194]|uniref:hypothetical protein n=1 Tax=Melissospora conviva TaxID=3388432 RepID=UPI003C27249A